LSNRLIVRLVVYIREHADRLYVADDWCAEIIAIHSGESRIC